MNFDDIMLDPASAFDSPQQVLDSDTLSESQKVHVLHRWEYDARQMLVAEGEGMGENKGEEMLQQVLAALKKLGAEPGAE